jgi:hypothetical protein
MKQAINAKIVTSVEEFLAALKSESEYPDPEITIGKCLVDTAQCAKFEEKIETQMTKIIEDHYRENREKYERYFEQRVAHLLNGKDPPVKTDTKPIKIVVKETPYNRKPKIPVVTATPIPKEVSAISVAPTIQGMPVIQGTVVGQEPAPVLTTEEELAQLNAGDKIPNELYAKLNNEDKLSVTVSIEPPQNPGYEAGSQASYPKTVYHKK